MQANNSEMICFYHNADLDGRCSGEILRRRYPKANMRGIDYGDDLGTLPGHEVTIVFTDVCLQPIEKMLKLAGEHHLIWIDHHKTAIEAANGVKWPKDTELVFGDPACATLTWQYCWPGKPVPLAVELLSRYDVWDLDPHVLDFQFGCRSYGLLLADPKWDELLYPLDSLVIDVICDQGRRIREYERHRHARVMEHAFETEVGTEATIHKVVACNTGPGASSQWFDSVYKPESHDLMCPFYLRGSDRKWVVSFYTTHEAIDCSAIAREFGGGGHRKAAGCVTSALPFRTKSQGD